MHRRFRPLCEASALDGRRFGRVSPLREENPTPMKIAAYLIEKIGSTVSGYFHPSLWLSESHGLLVTQSHYGIDARSPSCRNKCCKHRAAGKNYDSQA